MRTKAVNVAFLLVALALGLATAQLTVSFFFFKEGFFFLSVVSSRLATATTRLFAFCQAFLSEAQRQISRYLSRAVASYSQEASSWGRQFGSPRRKGKERARDSAKKTAISRHRHCCLLLLVLVSFFPPRESRGKLSFLGVLSIGIVPDDCY